MESTFTNLEVLSYLGRPWNSIHRSVFSKTYLYESIRSSGYIHHGTQRDWSSKETPTAEYKTSSPGFSDTSWRDRKIGNILTEEQFKEYSSPKVFSQTPGGRFDNVAWIDASPEVKQ